MEIRQLLMDLPVVVTSVKPSRKPDWTREWCLSAADSDIISSYVLRKVGIGIIDSMALEDVDDGITRNRDVSHLFPLEITQIAYHNGKVSRALWSEVD